MKSYWSTAILVFYASLILIAFGAQAQDDSQPGGSYRYNCFDATWDGVKGILRGYCGSGNNESALNYGATCEPGSTVSILDGALVCDQYIPSLPKGSYLASCVLSDWDPTTGILEVNCGDSQWLPDISIINYGSLCELGSTVSNSNGFLICDQYIPSLPRGSFVNSCAHIVWDAATSTLTAECQTSFGASNNTSLNYLATCMLGSEVVNSNGNLTCTKPCPGGQCPPCDSGYGTDSGLTSCIVCSTLDSNCTTCVLGKCTACAMPYSPSDDGSRCIDCRSLGSWNPYCVACAGGKCTHCSPGLLDMNGRCYLPKR